MERRAEPGRRPHDARAKAPAPKRAQRARADPRTGAVAGLQARAGNLAVGRLLGVQRDDKKPPPDKPEAKLDIPLIPDDRIRPPGPRDMLVGQIGGNLVVLPAQGAFVLVRPETPSTPVPPPRAPVPVVTVPTAAKTSGKMVGVGGQTGFMIDAGGAPGVVYPNAPAGVVLPGAMAAMTSALGVTTVQGLVITHLHEDHVQSLFEIVLNNRIPPGNLHFPEAFATNRAAPSSLFAQLLRRLETDPRTQALGYRPGAAYGLIRTPATGNWWRTRIEVGEVTFELYGISPAFRALEARRAAGQPQRQATLDTGETTANLADTASLITRATHRPSGFRAIFMSDARFPDLAMLKRAMGADYQELFEGVHTVFDPGHHVGAFRNRTDQTTYADFLKDAQLRSGRLVVVAQSEEVRSGRQFLNRGFIASMNAAGIEVHVAMEPRAGAVGTFTVHSDGSVAYAGGGRAESFAASTAAREQIARLNHLREVEDTLTRYGRFAEPQFQRAGDARAAREALERVLGTFMDTTAEGVPMDAAGRAQNRVTNPTDVARALAAAQSIRSPFENQMTAEYLAGVADLKAKGPWYEKLDSGIEEARRTGRMNDQAIEALWRLEPNIARRLLGSSGLPKDVQEETARHTPAQATPVMVRSTAYVLLALEAVNMAAPIMDEVSQWKFGKRVQPSLEDIVWWQDKGVQPAMEAVNDRWWPRGNVWTEEQADIQKMLNAKDIDYLSLTGIPEHNWDRLAVWATGKLRNYQDWHRHIVMAKAIRPTGDYMVSQTWEYRTSRISGATWGFDVEETWYRNPRLDKILQAAAKAVVKASGEQIASTATKQGPAGAGAAQQGWTPPLYSGLPAPTGKVTFKPGAVPMLYTLHRQYPRMGYDRADVYYTFADNAVIPYKGFEVPDDYVLVGGADFNTYAKVYATQNNIDVIGDQHGGHREQWVKPNTFEVLLARKDSLVGVK
jgi:hypothetical protein